MIGFKYPEILFYRGKNQITKIPKSLRAKALERQLKRCPCVSQCLYGLLCLRLRFSVFVWTLVLALPSFSVCKNFCICASACACVAV